MLVPLKRLKAHHKFHVPLESIGLTPISSGRSTVYLFQEPLPELWDFTVKEAQDVGFRVANLMRAFNLQHGVGVDLEQPSPRWSSTPVDGPAKGINIASHWDGMLETITIA